MQILTPTSEKMVTQLEEDVRRHSWAPETSFTKNPNDTFCRFAMSMVSMTKFYPIIIKWNSVNILSFLNNFQDIKLKLALLICTNV